MLSDAHPLMFYNSIKQEVDSQASCVNVTTLKSVLQGPIVWVIRKNAAVISSGIFSVKNRTRDALASGSDIVSAAVLQTDWTDVSLIIAHHIVSVCVLWS